MTGKGKKSGGRKRKSKERPGPAGAMTGKGKKSGGRKRKSKERPGPAGTSVRTKITTTVTKKVETYYDNSLKPETKGDKVETSTKSTPKKKEGPKKELESDQRGEGGDGQDKETFYKELDFKKKENSSVGSVNDNKVETRTESAAKKPGRPKKKPESDQRGAGGDGQDKEVKASADSIPIKKESAGEDGQDKEDEPRSDSTPQKSGQLKKKPESDQGAARGSDQDIKANGTTPKKITDMDSFVQESMRHKSITKVPGIEEESDLAESLEKKGYTLAEHLLAYFLSKDIEKAEGLFKQFIKENGGDEGCQNAVYNALEEWTNIHIHPRPEANNTTQTTKKKRLFAKSLMKDKYITDVPGIAEGSPLAIMLEKDGYTMAEHLLAYFLSKDIQQRGGVFKKFIGDHGGGKGAKKNVYKALKEWTDEYL